MPVITIAAPPSAEHAGRRIIVLGEAGNRAVPGGSEHAVAPCTRCLCVHACVGHGHFAPAGDELVWLVRLGTTVQGLEVIIWLL